MPKDGLVCKVLFAATRLFLADWLDVQRRFVVRAPDIIAAFFDDAELLSDLGVVRVLCL